MVVEQLNTSGLTDPETEGLGEHHRVPLLVGVTSGISGPVTFLVIHQIVVSPIWFISIIGVVISAGSGAVTAKCYSQTVRFRFPRPLYSAYVFVLVVATLLPCTLLIKVVPPLLQAENGEVVHPINVPWLVSGFFVLLIIPAIGVGWLMGRYLTPRGNVGPMFALMGFLAALGPGHNLPLFGGASGEQLFNALVLTFVPMMIAAVVMAEGTEIWRKLNPIRTESSGQPLFSRLVEDAD